MKKYCRKKGISILISHASFLAIGIVSLIIISSMVWGIYDSIKKEEIRKDLTRVSQTVATEILKLYSLKDSPARLDPNRSLLLGESVLSLQQKAGGRQYMIELMQSSQITITNLTEGNITRYATHISATSFDPLINVNHTLYNIDTVVQGAGFGDKPLILRYYRLNFNGTTEDRIVLNSDLVIAGDKIS